MKAKQIKDTRALSVEKLEDQTPTPEFPGQSTESEKDKQEKELRARQTEQKAKILLLLMIFVIVGVDVVVVTLRRREQMIPAAVCFERPDEDG